MEEIRGTTKNIEELLGKGKKFTIDYFQREYTWGEKQIRELINDLSGKFLKNYREGDERTIGDNYGHYFLGSIIVSEEKDNKGEINRKVIVDGQQRLTSLTLLLIHIYHCVDDDDKDSIRHLIVSRRRGQRSLNINIDERKECMTALFKKAGKGFEGKGKSESVVNILQRYKDIQKYFPPKLKGETLSCFSDWLIYNVHLVEITADSDVDAYTIFETMNDRGVPLTSTDKFKGYVLTSIGNIERRKSAIKVWYDNVLHVKKDIGNAHIAHFIVNWLRSQFYETYPKTDPGQGNFFWFNYGLLAFRALRDEMDNDYSNIQKDFYRWVRDNEERLSLKNSDSFAKFIERDFDFYINWYRRIFKASKKLTKNLEEVHLTWGNDGDLPPEHTLLFAPLIPRETEEESLRKIRVVAKYVDIVMARHCWSGDISLRLASDTKESEDNPILRLVKEVRGKPVDDLVEILTDRLKEDDEIFTKNQIPQYGGDVRFIHRILARITDFVETGSGRPSKYTNYINVNISTNKYEIEHILPKNPQERKGEFRSRARYRNYIGALLLLPRDFNASYGKKAYTEKREHYYGQNLLAQSLHERTYQNNPGFCKFNEKLYKETDHKFKPYTVFDKNAILERQELYRAIAKKIWDPETLRLELEN